MSEACNASIEIGSEVFTCGINYVHGGEHPSPTKPKHRAIISGYGAIQWTDQSSNSKPHESKNRRVQVSPRQASSYRICTAEIKLTEYTTVRCDLRSTHNKIVAGSRHRAAVYGGGEIFWNDKLPNATPHVEPDLEKVYHEALERIYTEFGHTNRSLRTSLEENILKIVKDTLGTGNEVCE